MVPHRSLWRARWALVLLLPLVLSACADVSYLAQSVAGHVKLMAAARPIDDWLADPATVPALRQRLRQVQSVRRFAVADLQLPDNASYQRYAALERPYVVWNVVAAPADSLTLKTWCFAVVGCVAYRGYFAQADAQALAAQLQAQGLEVSVYGVPAYSTLGWSNWLGGDPMLSTFVNYPDGELARLMFHELAHQVVFAPDDTAFNESFATAVERLGGARWLAQQATVAQRETFEVLDMRRTQLRDLTRRTRQNLLAIYKENSRSALTEQALIAMKNKAFSDFRAGYATLKSGWGGYGGYDDWVAHANNAALAVQGSYDEWVSAFEALFAREGRDWRRFYDAVRNLAQLDAQRRQLVLKALTPGLPSQEQFRSDSQAFLAEEIH
ncbi:MAG: aminopeptidase [Comamonadaceae bacterium CG12_big_fil_rev_8_21_14_0_65_59_15]|nr:MAG: aminopeptidase [Comamonadaceae bacterium CG12_big_fil_rev_8_21_14_0_65_59_15]